MQAVKCCQNQRPKLLGHQVSLRDLEVLHQGSWAVVKSDSQEPQVQENYREVESWAIVPPPLSSAFGHNLSI